MSLKKKYGQYYTTNYQKILKNIVIPDNITYIVEPFTGNGDLCHFIQEHHNYERFQLELYDIDPKYQDVINRDTLKNPVSYHNKYVITNPPFLARNKSVDKTIFNMYNTNDLYKCFIIQLINDQCLGGIIITPINFWSSIRKEDISLRKKFLDKYKVSILNIFEESMFDDTTYNICSFQFIKINNGLEFQFKQLTSDDNFIPITIYPSNKQLVSYIGEKNMYTIGGEIYLLPVNTKYKINRLIIGDVPNTNLVVKCIDSSEKINMKFVDDKEIYYDETKNKSARTYLTLTIEPNIEKKDQEKLANNFNKFLNDMRDKYSSLFLSNYRDGGRKRISFDLVYSITGYLLLN